MTKKSISYPDFLDEVIEAEIDAGLADGHSDWFQMAAEHTLDDQRRAINFLTDEEVPAEAYDAMLRDELDPIEFVDKLRRAKEVWDGRHEVGDE